MKTIENRDYLTTIVQSLIDKSAHHMNESYAAGESSIYKYWDGFHDCAEAVMRELNEEQKSPVCCDFIATRTEQIINI